MLYNLIFYPSFFSRLNLHHPFSFLNSHISLPSLWLLFPIFFFLSFVSLLILQDPLFSLFFFPFLFLFLFHSFSFIFRSSFGHKCSWSMCLCEVAVADGLDAWDANGHQHWCPHHYHSHLGYIVSLVGHCCARACVWSSINDVFDNFGCVAAAWCCDLVLSSVALHGFYRDFCFVCLCWFWFCFVCLCCGFWLFWLL